MENNLISVEDIQKNIIRYMKENDLYNNLSSKNAKLFFNFLQDNNCAIEFFNNIKKQHHTNNQSKLDVEKYTLFYQFLANYFNLPTSHMKTLIVHSFSWYEVPESYAFWYHLSYKWYLHLIFNN